MPIFLSQSSSNFIGSLFKCFFCCNKTNRYVEQNSNIYSINKQSKHLLDREYAKLKKYKIHTNTRIFYQRIMENFEIIVSENMIEKNIIDYKTNARQSKFDNSDNSDNYDNEDHINLFIRLSEAVYSLMENKKITFIEKISLIKNFSNNIMFDTYSYNESQRIFICEIFSSIIDYIYLDDHINKTIRYNTTNTLKITNLHIHNLFIDGKISYKDFNYYKYDIDNKGPFVTDYNRRYIERCVRAFSYMLQSRLKVQNKPISLSELINVNSILGGSKGVTTAIQRFQINDNSSENIIQLLSLGVISSEVISSDNSIIKYGKNELEDVILYSIGIQISLSDDETYQDSYRLSTEHFNTKDYIRAKEYLKNIDNKCNTGDLLQSLSGFTSKPAFKFRMCLTNTGKYIEMQYIYNTSKLETIERLLKSYYLIIEDIKTDLEKIRIMVWLCNTLEMLHPFSSSNSRTLLYNLLPILLYQQDLWLTKTLYDNKKILSFFPTTDIASKILELCIPLNNITITSDLNWLYKINYNEKFRIACAIGDLRQLEEVITESPIIIGKPIVVSSDKHLMHPVEFALRHYQVDVAKYLLKFNAWVINKQYAKEILSEYLESDEYYFNSETENFLDKIIKQQDNSYENNKIVSNN